MTQHDSAEHLWNGAHKALQTARILHEGDQYESALFYCHLAVEKALKSLYINVHDCQPPKSHNLVFLSSKIDRNWSEETLEQMQRLTDFVVDARYDTPGWAEQHATETEAEYWINVVEKLLSIIES